MTDSRLNAGVRLPNLDEQSWNENWLRIIQSAIDAGAIAQDDLRPALEDAHAHMAAMADAPRPITHLELYRGVVFPRRGSVPPAFQSLDNGSTDPATTVEVTMAQMSAWTLSPLVARLFAGAFALPDAGPCRGFIVLAQIPAERIFSNGLLGMGNLQLAEHVVLGGTIAAHVREIPHSEPEA